MIALYHPLGKNWDPGPKRDYGGACVRTEGVDVGAA